MEKVPGTNIKFYEGLEKNAFAVLSPIFSVTKGLTLSQLRELTGLESSTIQNWVKRGWIANPDGKRYGERQTVRIILINMLKGSMQLEKIAEIMEIINGNVEDVSDDIIPDIELYNHLCSIICACEKAGGFSLENLKHIVKNEITSYNPKNEKSRDIVFQALLTISLGVISADIKKLAENEFIVLKEIQNG